VTIAAASSANASVRETPARSTRGGADLTHPVAVAAVTHVLDQARFEADVQTHVEEDVHLLFRELSVFREYDLGMPLMSGSSLTSGCNPEDEADGRDQDESE